MTPDRVAQPDPGPGTPPSMNAERALHGCALAFGRPGPPGAEATAWCRLEPEWRRRMEIDDGALPIADPEEALQALRRSHRMQARADLGSVHPTWLERASQDESPAVRGLLARPGPAGRVDPEIAGWVRTLANERLVGGEPATGFDPPVVAALGGLPPRVTLRLADAVGRAKLALSHAPDPWSTDPKDARGGWFLERLIPRLRGEEDRLRQWALREVQRAEQAAARPSRVRAFLGMTTMARLLAACEPFRVRWALQHLPYPVAKRFRAIMAAPGQSHPLLTQIEEVFLRTAWERLELDGRVDLPYPEPIARPGHVP